MIKPYVVYIEESNLNKIKELTHQTKSHLALQFIVMEWLDEQIQK